MASGRRIGRGRRRGGLCAALAAVAAAVLLPVPAARAQSIESGYAGERLPLEQWARDPWFASVLEARGAVIGDLESRLEPGPEVGGGAADGGDEGDVAALPPAAIDASKPAVARLIRRWIDAAEPPKNATDGAQLRYSPRGRAVGRGAGGQGEIESRHETGSFDPVYLWQNWRKLDSVDHCTMEEYVVARLRGASTAECAGRYKPVVRDLVGERADRAQAALRKLGLKPVFKPGPRAETQEAAGTVARQSVAAGEERERGAQVTLWIRAPAPAAAEVPELVGMRAADAVAALESAGLKPVLKPGPAAARPADSGTVAAQGAEPGTSVEAGSAVEVTVYKPPVEQRTVPEVAGLSLDDARRRMDEAGLRVEVEELGEAASREQAGRVRASRPAPGAQVRRGARIVLEAYGAYVPTREEQVAAKDCTGVENSVARWSTSKDEPVCACPEDYWWTEGKAACAPKQQVATQRCQAKWPRSVPEWKSDGGYDCGCPDGYWWNRGKTACAPKQQVATQRCQAKWPRSVSEWKSDGSYDCGCPEGYWWNDGKTACVSKQRAAADVCRGKWPGSIPVWSSESDYECGCPDGQTWSRDRSRCITRQARAEQDCLAEGGRWSGGRCTTARADSGGGGGNCASALAQIDRYARQNQAAFAALLGATARAAGCDPGAIEAAMAGRYTGGGGGGGAGGELSCATGDIEERQCCCFKGAHTYRFQEQAVRRFTAVFDTGKRLGCRSRVDISVHRNDRWYAMRQVDAVSSRGGSEKHRIRVDVDVGARIDGIRIADGCRCCIDYSAIEGDIRGAGRAGGGGGAGAGGGARGCRWQDALGQGGAFGWYCVCGLDRVDDSRCAGLPKPP